MNFEPDPATVNQTAQIISDLILDKIHKGEVEWTAAMIALGLVAKGLSEATVGLAAINAQPVTKMEIEMGSLQLLMMGFKSHAGSTLIEFGGEN